MKTLLIAAVALASFAALAQTHYVQPHTNSNGTYVQGHYQTNSNGTKLDNYSTQGNTNPYTGQSGTVNPYAQSQQPKPQQCGYTQSGRYVCQ